VPEVIATMRGRIWNLHVEDLPGRKHYHMIPGEGTFDWPVLRDALRGIDYDRFATVELYTHTADPHAAAIKSYLFLGQLFER
jgi:sugar phosphate isomerase/epimerase